jgi:o-succinylbenzoate synthase
VNPREQVRSIALFAWGGPAGRGVLTAAGSIAQREGWVVRMESTSGRVGLGEATPLSELRGGVTGQATLDALRAARDFPRPSFESFEQVAAWLTNFDGLVNAARFGFETALLDLLAQSRSRSLAAELTADFAPSFYCTHLLGALASPTLEARARAARDLGYRALKLKVGPSDLEQASERLAHLRNFVGAEMRLRVDCNGALSADEFESLVPALAAAEIEFVEEPCALEPESEARRRAWAAAGLRLFVDESLSLLGATAMDSPAVCGVVLKPSLLGGLLPARAFAKAAHERGLEIVVSHAFEGPIALAAMRELACALAPGDLPQGLEQHAGLTSFTNEAPSLAATMHAGTASGLGANDPTHRLHEVERWTF